MYLVNTCFLLLVSNDFTLEYFISYVELFIPSSYENIKYK